MDMTLTVQSKPDLLKSRGSGPDVATYLYTYTHYIYIGLHTCIHTYTYT